MYTRAPLPPRLVVALLIAASCQPGSGGKNTPETTNAGLVAVRPGDPSQPRRPPPRRARVIVKLQAARDPGVARAVRAGTGIVDVTAADPAFAALTARHAVRSTRALHANRIGQRLRRGLSEGQLAAGTRQRFATRAARAPWGAITPDLSGLYLLDLGLRTPPQVQRALAALRTDPAVLHAEEDLIYDASYLPDDPLYPQLHGLSRIGTPAAWDTGRGAGATVAVIDTGIDYHHPDIDENVWLNTKEIPDNGIDDDQNGYVDDQRGWDFIGASVDAPVPDNDPMDVHGHGTHVAGTVAAEGDNALGVVGVAWKAKVMAVRGLDDHGSGSSAALAAAIVYAADQGADVINASWGAAGFSQTIEDAIAYAHAMGVVFVAAAGNSSADAAGFHPASSPDAVTVSALNVDDTLAGFSNFGDKLDVAAPGVDILSLERGTSGYVRFQGTSMAAPHVSGVAALVLGRHPEFTSEQVRQVLRGTAVDLGASGKDPSFGFGRVGAATAVLVDHPLEARILSPAPGTVVLAPVPIAGTVRGAGLAHWLVERGSGLSPATWTTLAEGDGSVVEGTLATFDPSALVDGTYSVRLRALHQSGQTWLDQTRFEVRYAAISTPAPPIPAVVHIAKPGLPLEIRGRAAGPGFQHFALEWAPGPAATGGWSSAGITLAGGGTSPIVDGLLGTWTPPPGLAGDHSLRVVLTRAGFDSEGRSGVYLEPSLVSGAWPRDLGRVNYHESLLPVRREDGSMRLASCTGYDLLGSTCRLFAADGSTSQVALSRGSQHRRLAADLDGQPGDELVLADGDRLRVVSADLAPIREIPVVGHQQFGVDPTILVDLDGDGRPEILALTRSTVSGMSGTLQVYRADGQAFSPVYPVAIGPPDASFEEGYWFADVVAVDLDGDGRKEILVSTTNTNSTRRIVAFSADGSPYAPWPTFLGTDGNDTLFVADLDHDGSGEVLFSETKNQGEFTHLHALTTSGAERPGWPVVAGWGSNITAIGDVDRDGHDEIVLVTGEGVDLLRADGTRAPGAWPIPESWWIEAVLADTDGDGAPEVVLGTVSAEFASGVWYRQPWLRIHDRLGTMARQWRLSGLNGREGFHGVVTVGDFNGDGMTDLAVNTPLVRREGAIGYIDGAAATLLTAGTPFNPAGADWPIASHDPQNSGARDPLVPADGPPRVQTPATATPSLVTGTTTALSVLGADHEGEANLTYTWSVTGTPPAPVGFSPNGGHAARQSTATFGKPGTYSLRVLIQDGRGQAAASNVVVTVVPALAALVVTPASATVVVGTTRPFAASGTDQFGLPIATPSLAWSVAGGGTIDANGLFTATAVGGPFAVTAASGGVRGTAAVTVTGGSVTTTLAPSADAYVRDGSSDRTNYGRATELVVKTTAANANRMTYLRFPLSSLKGPVTKATLRLYGSRPATTSTTDSAFAVSSNSWSETGITWSNKPALGARQGSRVVTKTARYHDWDVTAWVKSQRAAGATSVNLAVKMDAKVDLGPDTFHSREASNNRPQLVVTAGP